MSSPVAPAADVRDPEQRPPGPSPRPGRVWALAILGAIAAGVVPFLVGEACPTPFVPPMETVPQNGQRFARPIAGTVEVAERKNAMVAFAAVGGCLALAFGLAGGLARGSVRSGLVAAMAGVVLGVGLGAGASAALVTVYQRRLAASVEDMNGDLAFPTLIQAGIWAALGLGAGAALGLGAGAGRRFPAVALGGLVGGVLGAVVYEVAASLLSPGSRTYRPIAETWPPRLLAATVVPILVAAVAASALLAPSRRSGR